MKDLIELLIEFETNACEYYDTAADYFKTNRSLADKLITLANDERFHLNLMKKASELLANSTAYMESEFILDPESIEKIKSPIRKNMQRLNNGSLTEENLLDSIIETEFSEWNDIFLYVINRLKTKNPDFQHVASTIQNHMVKLEALILAMPNGEEKLATFRGLRPIWDTRILIIDDSEAVRDLLGSIFETDGKIEQAADGKAALKMVREMYFDLILTDVDMPKMTGIEFYKEAIKINDNLAGNFIFFTGSTDPAVTSFLEENKIKYLPKPSPLNDIRTGAASLLKNSKAT